MHVPERYWWAWLVAAGVMLAAAVYFGAENITGKLAIVTILQLPDAQAAAVSLLYVGLPSVMCVVWLVKALRARGRYVRRKAALAWDANAMPLARQPSVEGALPTVATAPYLPVRSERRGPLVEAARVAVVALIVYFFAIVAAAASALALVNVISARGPFVSETRNVAVSLTMTWLMLGVFNPMRQQVRQLVLLAANAEGIEYRRELGRRVVVRWSEMRLVEVVSSGWGGFPRTYRVYSQRRVVEWSMSPAATNGRPDAFDQRQVDIMAALVLAQTSLTPHTFSKPLRADRGDWPPDPTRGLAPTLLVLGLVTLALAAAVVALPLTTSGPLNVAVAVPLAALALGSLVASWMSWPRQALASEFDGDAGPPVETRDDPPGAVYGFTTQTTALGRSGILALGIGLGVGLIPGMFSLSAALQSLLGPAPLLRRDTWASTPIACLLLLYGLIGLALVASALLKPQRSVTADDEGLRMDPNVGAARHTTAWERIGGITAKRRGRKVIRYIVTNRDGQMVAAWGARPTWMVTLRPAPHQRFLAPEELAALVARRSGQPIRLA